MLVILWLLGMVTSVTAGGLIHLLLVVAIVVVLLRIIGGAVTHLAGAATYLEP